MAQAQLNKVEKMLEMKNRTVDVVTIPIVGKYKLEIRRKLLDAKVYGKLMLDGYLSYGAPVVVWAHMSRLIDKLMPLALAWIYGYIPDDGIKTLLAHGVEVQKKKKYLTSPRLESIPEEEELSQERKRTYDEDEDEDGDVYKGLLEKVKKLKTEVEEADEVDFQPQPQKKARKPRSKPPPLTPEQEAQIEAVIDSVVEESRKYAELQEETDAAVAALLSLNPPVEAAF